MKDSAGAHGDTDLPSGWEAEISHDDEVIRYRYTDRSTGEIITGMARASDWESAGTELHKLIRRRAQRQAMESAGVTGPQISRKILEMIGRLHQAGLESLYIDPHMAPSGCYWRYSIGIASAGVWPQSGSLGSREDDAPEGSVGGGFDQRIPWCLPADTLEAYAEKFQRHYAPRLGPARRPNPDYVRWYREMLERTAPLGVLIFSSDMGPDYEYAYTWGPPRDFRMPMPPGFRRRTLGRAAGDGDGDGT